MGTFHGLRRIFGASAAMSLSALAAAAQADVVISDRATENMTCSNGVCTPTAADAVLNAGDLETLLAFGDLTVTTKGPDVQARDIQISNPFGWKTGSRLELDASRSTVIDAAVSVQGQGGLTIHAGGNGALSFSRKGHVTFANLASSLVIYGYVYTLENSIMSLAKAVAHNPNGAYALANNYDAAGDGTYHGSPIGDLRGGGVIEGLGNTLSNLTITGKGSELGLVAITSEGSRISDVTLRNAHVTLTKSARYGGFVGALVGYNVGDITGDHVTGTVTGNRDSYAGGIAGYNSNRAYVMRGDDADVAVVVGARSEAGGLVGINSGIVVACYATGSVKGLGRNTRIGGLVGGNYADVVDSYARGSVQGADSGGLIGYNGIGIEPAAAGRSYSTGKVRANDYAGGLIGYDATRATYIARTYWDTNTSRITDLGQGAGWPSDDAGITGLTTKQLRSGLPRGFPPRMWAENPSINDGLPYLLADPPE